MSAARAKGTLWESALVAYLRDEWDFKHCERRALAGAADRGDIAGVATPDGPVMIEAKSARAITLAAWMDEVTAETANARAHIGVAWIKRRGKTSPAAGYVVMTGHTFMELLADRR